jgi:hypothetical protein
MNIRTSLLGGLGLGAVLMYLLDPERGRRRRAMVRDRVASRACDTEVFLKKSRRDLGNRARGFAAETRSRFVREGPVDDDVLAERVRSKMGRFVSHPGAIEVTADEGWIRLEGQILADEVDHLVSAVQSVRGVEGVDNKLEIHWDSGAVPALQGGAERTGERAEFRQQNWSPAARLAAGGAGSALVLLGLKRRGPLGMAASAIGTGILARSVTNKSARRLGGFGNGHGPDEYRTSLSVDAPPSEFVDNPGDPSFGESSDPTV